MVKFIQNSLNSVFILVMVIIVVSCTALPVVSGGDRSSIGTYDESAPYEDAVKSEKDEIAAPVPRSTESSTLFKESFSGEEELYASSDPDSFSERAPLSSGSGLKAGYSDDNRQFNYFLKFLDQYKNVPHLDIDISERITFYIRDINGRTVPNAEVEIKSKGSLVTSGITLADGSFMFFPSLYSEDLKNYEIRAIDPLSGKKTGDQFTRGGRREINLTIEEERKLDDEIPMDILFILDTTGSMGDEIERLKATIELIHLNLSSLSSKPVLRFGLVLYKDIGDEEYRTKIIPLTKNLDKFQKELNRVEASGGGDTPEDLQAALEDSLKVIKWNTDGIRMAFIITDAPPHLMYGQEYDYTYAAREAKERGIKIHSVGTGGLPLGGEYILRQISQFTSGRYIFLTYGEEGESDGGVPGSVSHHTGSNFQTDKLEAIIIRFAKEELGYLSDKPLESDDSYFEANMIDSETREDTLDTLFGMAVEQLRDYSAYSVNGDTRAAVMPFDFNQDDIAINAEYFTERLIISFDTSDTFKLVERKDIQKILEEQNLQLSGVTDGENAVKVGKILNADVLITGKLFRKDNNYELFLRLVRVETGEILSVTRAVIDEKLGL